MILRAAGGVRPEHFIIIKNRFKLFFVLEDIINGEI